MKQPRDHETRRPDRDSVRYIGPVVDPINTAIDDVPSFQALGGFGSACEREEWVDRDALRRKWCNAFLGSLSGRLRCRACGNRLVNKWILGRLPR
ncbi:hypothetical protein [Agrobacterium cavarae]|uniref:hypothetical protein n=1 Tax=Agrobacterium cavarae TaxID=2528239 RepID=UPI003EE5D6C5